MAIIDFIKQKIQSAFLFENNQVKQESIPLTQEKPIKMMDLLYQQELERIDTELVRLQKMHPAEIPQLVPNHRSGVVWRIPVPRQSEVFMQLRGGEHPVEQSDFVVYVRGLAFYRAWLTLDASHPCPLQQNMSNDYKFNNAVGYFSKELDKPAPIANMAILVRDGELIVSFTDGITRTLWLLAHNVQVFPVLCHDLASASLLANKAGIAEPVPIPILEQGLTNCLCS